MEHSAISNMILKNDMVLQSQPKWTFIKNTCNTYEVFVTHFRNPEGNVLPSWPILQIVEKDDALCQLRPRYAKALEEYRRLLAQKGAALREQYDRPGMLELIPEYNERMAQTGAILITTRAKYLRQLEQRAAIHHDAFSGGGEALCLRYQTVSTVQDPTASALEVYGWLREHQQSHYRAELESMQCLSGPHKDDFEAELHGISLKAFGSQGQTRTTAISLKLAERDLFEADTGELPVLLLDDVLSELDPGRQDFVLNRIQTGQVFISCCEQDKVTQIGKTISIESGRIV